MARVRDSFTALRRDLRESAPESPRVPWVSIVLALSIALTAVVTGSFVHALPARVGSQAAFGWPALVAGRWWTVATSFLITRDWFMAATMPLALLVALGPYERRAGPTRAFVVAALGHVSGSVVIAVASGPLSWTGQPVLVRAAQNLDYGGSMAVAAAVGALASRLGRRWVRLALIAVVLLVPLHHQMADWGHLVALPFGFAADRVRRPAWSRAALVISVGATAALTAYGPWAVSGIVNAVRFPDAADAAGRPPAAEQRGSLVALQYQARALASRPEVALVYVPPRAATPRAGPFPVIVFLHGVPGAARDWTTGGAITQMLDQRIAGHQLPASVGVFPNADEFSDPSAGWKDAAPQLQLRSIRRDLLPALGRHYRIDTRPRSAAVVGVGRGADGALGLARADGSIGYVIALGPHHVPPSTNPTTHRYVVGRRPRGRPPEGPVPASTRWSRWRSELPAALDWLATSGFGTPGPAAGGR